MKCLETSNFATRCRIDLCQIPLESFSERKAIKFKNKNVIFIFELHQDCFISQTDDNTHQLKLSYQKNDYFHLFL